MSNWDLMMPGMGLTSIGLAGVVLSYAEIAHTFIDGMHALSGLTMFVGLIFLAAGILDGGISTSNRAKATTLVILSIALGFGAFALSYGSSSYTLTLAGVLMGIAFPAIIIAYLAMKHPKVVKPIGSITAMAAATGIIMWVAFGFVSPDTYMVPQAAPVEEEPVLEPDVVVTMLEGSDVDGAPDYDPDGITVERGQLLGWFNADIVAHTATSSADLGETFDTGLVATGDTYVLDTSALEAGTYDYICIVHPWMTSTLEITDPAGPDAVVVIPEGAATVSEGQVYYEPAEVSIPAGGKVLWENEDPTLHTASGTTDGTVAGTVGGPFDSGIISAGGTFEQVFDEPGTYEYICTLHPWMIGTVTVTAP
ncbi:MAG: plastocyanin/azurin family copper-binding protein [Nitrosopumilus sp.]|nr:plastocyanin/azurin family copper-binding protein [Nitrosopumilus sp.]MDA7942648.1 plastocyanin/azurin family copper-binding protein [Nitrosopumilus sp.]MDA7998582.1 plastocyanin/azurin family copper-binding protein [Nitrosopumilus sp.]